jgi:hypothetical protein
MCLRSTLAISYFTNNILLSRLDLSIIYLYNRKNRIATPIPNTTLSEKLATADTEILRHVTRCPAPTRIRSTHTALLRGPSEPSRPSAWAGLAAPKKSALLARSPSRLGRSVATQPPRGNTAWIPASNRSAALGACARSGLTSQTQAPSLQPSHASVCMEDFFYFLLKILRISFG